MLHDEPGGRQVETQLEGAAISSVNLAEVMQRSLARRVELDGIKKDLEAVGLTIISFTADDAEAAAKLWPAARRLGLSLGGRACLATAQRLNLPAATADRIWSKLEIGIKIQLIR